MGPQAVGIRQLKAQLSRYIDRAARGRTVVVTEHGRPVALLTPVPEGLKALDELKRSGWLKWEGGKPDVRPIAVAHSQPSLTAAVLEVRGR